MTEPLLASMQNSEFTLPSTKSIILHSLDDQLVITHTQQIWFSPYLIQNQEIKLGNQTCWLPCEIEALISASFLHFNQYIPITLLSGTTNKPCIQSWHKTIRGAFSTSTRFASFMTTLSDIKIAFQHITGCYNLPSDFHYRNFAERNSCQNVKYVDFFKKVNHWQFAKYHLMVSDLVINAQIFFTYYTSTQQGAKNIILTVVNHYLQKHYNQKL